MINYLIHYHIPPLPPHLLNNFLLSTNNFIISNKQFFSLLIISSFSQPICWKTIVLACLLNLLCSHNYDLIRSASIAANCFVFLQKENRRRPQNELCFDPNRFAPLSWSWWWEWGRLYDYGDDAGIEEYDNDDDVSILTPLSTHISAPKF